MITQGSPALWVITYHLPLCFPTPQEHRVSTPKTATQWYHHLKTAVPFGYALPYRFGGREKQFKDEKCLENASF